MAGGLGFEPRFPVPKTGVLPLDDPPKPQRFYRKASPVKILARILAWLRNQLCGQEVRSGGKTGAVREIREMRVGHHPR